MNKSTRMALAVSATVLGLSLTGCTSSMTERFNDAPISVKDDSPAEVYSMPDGFANIAAKCDKHGNRMYSTRESDAGAGKAVAVIPDPSCKK